MQTDRLERNLRDALRETLDRELGPDPAWTESPAARRVAELERRRRWPLRLLAVAAMIGAVGGGVLLAGALNQPRPTLIEPAGNGWVAFTVAQEDLAGGGSDVDVWFTALGEQPRRVVGTDTDNVDQVCPAFSPDGSSLAYGAIEGIASAGALADYRDAALVIADVADDGSVAERLTIDVGDGVPPACAVWSPDGDRLAFGVPLTSAINPDRSGEGSEVWVVRLSDRAVARIPDLLATDLDWSPDGTTLAILGGVATASGEGVIDGLQDARIHLYEVATGTLRTLDDTLGAGELTWSPDSGRIAYAGRDSAGGLRVIDLDTGRQEILTAAYASIHGIGPVWSPDGERIVYQRCAANPCSGERTGVVLLTPDDRFAQTGHANEVALPVERTTVDGSNLKLTPWRVVWSPDGTYLLYVAWPYAYGGGNGGTMVVAVPTDPDAPAVMLADDAGIGPYDFSGEAMRVPLQVWQRRPAAP